MNVSFFIAAAFVSAATCSGPSGRAGADDMVRPLFEDGRTAWVVVIPDAPSKYMTYAAGELAATLKKISGATFGIVEAADAPRRNVLRLESDCREDLFDEFSAKETPGEIVFRGNTQRGTLFAVYAFLRERFDARWYWPGESGEFLPKMARYNAADWEKKWRPFFNTREFSICSVWRHRHADTEHWFPKVFLNCGINSPEIREEIDYVRRTSGHNTSLPVVMKERQKVFDEHPDWFSLLNGKRDISGIAGCWSNEGFYNYTVSNLVKRIRDNRAVLANFFVADIVPRCECADCTKDPDKSARFWNYYAKLIEGIRKEIPGMTFAGLAYQEYRAIPGIKVTALDHVDYCQYNRCYYHALEDASCAMNARSMKEFRGWAAQAPLGLYGYEFNVFSPAVYLPMWRVFADEMRIFKRMGLKRVKTECSVGLNRLFATRNNPALPPPRIGQLASRLSYYAWAMAAFDPDLDMDALVDDFCRHVYGAGADAMKAYHNLMADAWDGMKTHKTYFHNPARGAAAEFLPEEREAVARKHLAAAAVAAKGDARASGEIALDIGCLDVWSQFAKEARDGGVIHDMKEYREDAFNMVPWLKAKAKKGKMQPTRFKVYRGADALHVLAECGEKNVASLNRGTDKNDAHDWGSPTIEFFIDTGDGAARQIAVTPAGGVWDAKDGDKSWNCGAVVRPSFDTDKWTLDIALPYATFGDSPKDGDRWKFMVIRNESKGGFASCGWPVNAHRDFSSAATLVFK
jgi:hypothetical protein